jgi:Zn-dependent alcohol dehydrogenase
MKAAVLYEAGRPLEIEDLAMPAVGEDDVLIKVAESRSLQRRRPRHHRHEVQMRSVPVLPGGKGEPLREPAAAARD